MTITWLCLFWLFFFYSFIGWCIEVCAAAVQHRKFVNRGFVAGPLCPIYGFGAILFEIFPPELTEDPFFMFLGGFVLASLLEYSTGMFFEKVYKKKLWDYSRFRYNVGGYICLPFSLLWGILSVVTVMFADPLLCGLFDRIPHLLSVALLLVLGSLLLGHRWFRFIYFKPTGTGKAPGGSLSGKAVRPSGSDYRGPGPDFPFSGKCPDKTYTEATAEIISFYQPGCSGKGQSRT